MRKYYTAFAVVALLAMLVTAVCLVSFQPVESLIKPPMSDGENYEIQLAFEQAVNKKFKVRVPIGGNYRAAYIFNDLNADLQDEVIVFYSTEDALDTVRMNYMAKINQKWVSVADIESAYSEIHQVEFADLDNDGIKEILVGWAVYQNDLSRNLSVYRIPYGNSGELENIYSVPYSDFESIDIDNNGTDDIAVFENIDASPSYMQLSFDTFYNGRIVRADTVKLDSSVYSVMNISYDSSELYGYTRIFIDGYKIDSGIVTECVYWSEDDNKLKKLSSDNITVLSTRMTNIACEDTDMDGLIDVPLEITLENSKVISDSKADGYSQTIIKWVQISTEKYDVVTYQLVYANNNFRITFSEEWLDKITVYNNYSDNSIRFYLTESDSEKPLFELKYVSTQAQENQLTANYRLLTKTDKGKLFYVIYYTDRNFNISRSSLEKIIVV